MTVLFLMGVFSTTLTAAEGSTESGHHRRNISIHPAGTVHKMGDWFATRHMPKEQRREAMERRREKREVLEAEEKVKRDQRWAEKKTILDADKKTRAK